MKNLLRVGILIGLWALGAVGAELPLTPESTMQIGRGAVEWLADSVCIDDAYMLVNESDSSNFIFSFEGRAPENAAAEEVGIWATFRQFDRNHRYVIGLRGAPHFDLYLARYAPDGNDRMLALKSVPTLIPGEWAELKVVANGVSIQVFLNGVEQIVVEDVPASFKVGKVGLGGGYHPSEYRRVQLTDVTDKLLEPQFADGAKKINFQPKKSVTPAGWLADSGEAYSAQRGIGWSQPVGTRDRKVTGQTLKDTVVTVAHDQVEAEFRVDLDPGDYLLTLHHGDQHSSVLSLNFGASAPHVLAKTLAGKFEIEKVQLRVGPEGLRMVFLRKAAGPGTSLNWLAVEPREELSASQWVQGAPKRLVSPEKMALRKKQRAAYTSQKVAVIPPAGRSEISLDGDWLFLPDYQFKNMEAPELSTADDSQWHVMPVPALWSPYAAWLFGEGIKDIPGDKGPSDTYYEFRHARVEAFTFDWEKTRSAWYRKYVALPEIPDGKRVELQFDAVAKVAYVYVNGEFVGKNYGMFGPFSFDVTDHLKPGSNVIAVKVDDERNDIENGDEIIDVAISVEITRKMLSALPYGMTRQNARGIWQSTRLLITDAVRITDVFVQPSLEGAVVEMTLKNQGDAAQTVVPQLKVTSETDALDLIQVTGAPVTVPAGADLVTTLRFDGLAPRLWSPDDPQLYTFATALSAGEKEVDALSVVSGFRTFETKGNRLYLNGRPYALRGANHCPNIIAPMDGALADRFMQIMKENNLNSTRFHAMPGTTPWMEAADRNGVLISYEGTWPWLMLRGAIPPQESLDIWMDEFQRMIKKYRNHPSLMLWTVNNEMKFHVWHEHGEIEDADALARWKVVSKAVQMIHETDSTRPVVADSCYMRNDYWVLPESPEALGIDDGDIDDKHGYFNWYDRSFFNLLDNPESTGLPNRPLIGQEMSTGYYNGDSGHPVRAYLFAHQTPQSWVGQYAYEHRDPSTFYTRHGMLTKELAEYFRRERRSDWSGTLIFGLVTWFQNQWLADEIKPYPVVTDGLRNAMSPVLISARLTGRNVFAGESFTIPVSVVNDAENGTATPVGTLNWSIQVEGQALSKGSLAMPKVPYYSNKKKNVTLTAPAKVPGGRADAQLVFELVAGGEVIASNHYALRVAERAWAVKPAQSAKGKVMVFQPLEEKKGAGSACFQTLEIKPAKVSSLSGVKLGADDCLVLNGKLSQDDQDALKKIIAAGKGRVVWIRPQAQAKTVFPDQILNYRKQDGEVVTMHVAESPVFNGIEVGDLAWMGGPTVERVPVSSFGGYHVNWKHPSLTVLAEEMRAHGYLKTPKDKLKYWVAPLVQIQAEGSAPVILSEMSVDVALTDPIALRLWANLLSVKY